MKILIWFLCILANASIITVLKQNGVILGAIPSVILFSLTMGCARTLCIKWEEHKKTNEQRSRVLENEYTDKIGFCRKCGKNF